MMDPHRLAHASFAEQRAFLVEAVAANSLAMTVLERAQAMGLPDHGLMAVRLDADGEMELLAPFGLEQLFSLHVRPVEALADRAGWNAKCVRQHKLWPEISFDRV